jgi:hypothetical protein
MTAIIRKNVDGDVVNTRKAGNLVKAKMYFLTDDQYDDSQPFPAANGRERGNIPLNSGEYWHYIKSVLDTPEVKWSGSIEEVAAKIANEITMILGGMEDDTFDLLQDGIGQGFYVVIELCFTDETVRFLIGNGCKPAKLTAFEGGAMKDYTGTTVTFKVECGEVLYKYVGAITLQDPQTIAADAITFALTSNDTYEVATGTASTEIANVTAVTDTDINRIIVVKGGGGAGPSKIVTGGNFLLSGGEEWLGDAGEEISFRIMKDGDASYKLVEIYGTRTN